ncbi:MAG: tetratricopeptide repeat protein [Ignavibacteria bacterium]|nr:tetratricopeptide repeat protein [Ignavibacteria bacterium]
MVLTEIEAKIQLSKDEANKGNFETAEILAYEVLAELVKFSTQITSSELSTNANAAKTSVTHNEGLHGDSLSLKANAILALSNVEYRRGNFDLALGQAHRALTLAVESNLLSCKAKAWNMIGLVNQNLGNYDKSLEYYYNALSTYTELVDSAGIARVIGNIGVIYYFIGNFDKALEYYNMSLVMHTELRDIAVVATVNVNIGIVYADLGNYDKALEYYNNSLSTHTALGDSSGVASVMGSIGIVYADLGIHDKALEYYNKALETHTKLGENVSVARVTANIAIVYADSKYEGYDTAKAEMFFLKSIESSLQIGAKPLLSEIHKSLADLFENEKRWEDFAVHYKKYIEIEKEVNVEEVKKQDAIREQRKAIEIAKATADAKHQATEELLHNVLPPSIAHRILGGEKLIAEKIPCVSVLFADIVNFTKLSQRITPEELVEGLDSIFSTFDALAEKYGLEKIKTIGDAYMVVSGAPVQREDHAESMANFALEMVEAMKEFRSISTGEEIQLRIGIHSGEVVAGVIGKKKFAYDLWGDAVNTASRMESHGEAGKIHVSEKFLKKLLMVNGEWLMEEADNFSSFTINNLPLTIIPRGEMEIKGKGMMRTYFLEKNIHSM